MKISEIKMIKDYCHKKWHFSLEDEKVSSAYEDIENFIEDNICTKRK